MAARKGLGKGLGKGIGALIPTAAEDEPIEETAQKVTTEDKEAESAGKAATDGKASGDAKAGADEKASGTAKIGADGKTSGTAKAETAGKATTTSATDTKGQTTSDITDEKPKDAEGSDGATPVSAEIMLKTTLIEPNKNQPRKEFDIELLRELADSILEVGILQPIIVRKKDDKYYEIIAGERRWRAAKLAKLKEVPVIVRDFTPEEVMEAALIENIQRRDLNPIEEAKAFENLINEYNLKQEDVAKKVSKSRAQISNIMRLLKLDDKLQGLVVTGELSTGHARALLALGNAQDMEDLAKTVIDNGLSVRETEKLVKKMTEETGEKPAKREPSPAMELVYREIEKKLEKSIGSPVKIKSRDGKKGSIQIDYFSREELERITDKLGK